MIFLAMTAVSEAACTLGSVRGTAAPSVPLGLEKIKHINQTTAGTVVSLADWG